MTGGEIFNAGVSWAAALAFPAALVAHVALHDAPGAVATTDRAEVCSYAYAYRHRPPLLYTWAIKRMMTLHPSRYELDHVLPLELGGASYDLANLRLQPWPEARRKDAAETAWHDAVCSGPVPLAEAQAIFLKGRDAYHLHR